MSVPRSVLKYQQECFREYGKDVGLPRKYTYPDGNPIRPLPPYYVSTRGLMIVGAYPSARFEFRLPAQRGAIVALCPSPTISIPSQTNTTSTGSAPGI